ncbi:MAG: hypothetical protein F6K28_15230 [Microcoleus sp. SIO2G3]|nr:hypothetical protein [Microcoleus sp. SIO2G3]
MIPLDTRFPALARFHARSLPYFSVKLLNFPADITHLTHGIRRILSQVVSDYIFRSIGRDRYPEKFHLIVLRKSLALQ